jgi:exodeoxyribonuclease V alpha subunit
MANFADSATPKPAQPAFQQLEGTLERITFQNEENGYTVARLVPKGKDYEVTLVGTLSGATPGSSLRLQGMWTNHPQYGRQFEVIDFSVLLPATVEGIRKYLGSGLIKGIGPVTAKHIVDRFGMETLDIIEHTPHRLREVPGMGERRTTWITLAWEEQKQIKEIMVFLQSHGVSTSLAVKIFKQYGEAAIQVVQNEPYRLAKDIYGIGFKTADKIARQLGMPPDSPARIQAGLLYTLSQLSDEGHCFATQPQLVEAAAGILELTSAACQEQLASLVQQSEVIAEDFGVNTGSASTGSESVAIYLPPFYRAELGVANKLRRMQSAAHDRLEGFRALNWDKALAWIDETNAIRLTEQQKAAIRMALTEKVSILTGGPGTGKSTITGSLIRMLKTRGSSVLLAAPTGRAAKRLSEATGLEAKTIHRLLEFKPAQGNQFLRDQENPLDSDLIIVDETSMVDILLMNHLLNAIDAGCHLLLVGDVDQLPSVGPGNVLRDLIASGAIPVTRLDTIFRQAEDSFIIVNAHRINQGQMPLFAQDAQDFFLFAEPDAAKAADWVLELVARRIPARFGYRSNEDIQVLSPMHRGAVGVSDLNERLQAELNPPGPGKVEHRHGHRILREGDRVMQIRNDYDRIVFNGDMGRIDHIDLEDQIVIVSIDERAVEYDFSQLDELVHAYAVSIHKAQGSEFPVVVIPLLTQHYMMLQRNLLYTGVTRARKLVVLVGSKQAIAMAVRNNRITQRNTRLAQRLVAPALPGPHAPPEPPASGYWV